MSEFLTTKRGFREMPEVVAAAGADMRQAWVNDPEGVERTCRANEAARRQRDYEAALAEAKRLNQPPPPKPAEPLDERAQQLLAAAEHAHHDRLAAARAGVSSPDPVVDAADAASEE